MNVTEVIVETVGEAMQTPLKVTCKYHLPPTAQSSFSFYGGSLLIFFLFPFTFITGNVVRP